MPRYVWKTHAREPNGRAVCSVDGRTTENDALVDCLVCLYWLGAYVPLKKLREHQAAQRLRADQEMRRLNREF